VSHGDSKHDAAQHDAAQRDAAARDAAASTPDLAPRESLLALTKSELEALCAEHGGRPFHARIVRENVLSKGLLDYEQMTSLPSRLRAALAERAPIFSGREVDRSVAADRTTKVLIEFPRGKSAATSRQNSSTQQDSTTQQSAAPPQSAASPQNSTVLPQKNTDATVEMVHMPSLDLGDTEDAHTPGATLCVSTQVGCPVACPFCASGQLGLLRNLKSHEIVEQYVRGRAIGPLSRSVVMGMGEPLLNYEALSAALDVVHDEMKLGARKITVSTVGFPGRLREIAPTKPRFQLAISLHTPDQEQRDVLVPAMAGTPIEEVIAAGDDWFEKTGREITYEYVLLGGENDSLGHANRLVARLFARRATVNLIPFNPVSESPYRRPSPNAIADFQATLREAGIVATVRWSRGVESDSACGQLRVRHARGVR
jgi:adenine C2-methylase RlmN of 23S rRNA A2503 and tRNA A37